MGVCLRGFRSVSVLILRRAPPFRGKEIEVEKYITIDLPRGGRTQGQGLPEPFGLQAPLLTSSTWTLQRKGPTFLLGLPEPQLTGESM